MPLTKIKGSVWDSSDNGLSVNVKDFGAVGDGVTDDTAAIQAAIDSCRPNESGPAKKVYVPVGRYRVSQLTVYSHTGLIGEAYGASHSQAAINNTWGSRIHQLSSSNTDLIVFANDELPGNTSLADITLKYLELRGNWTGPGDVTYTSGSAINCGANYFVQGCEISNLTIHNFPQHGISGTAIPLPGMFKQIWGRYIGGSVLSFVTVGTRTGHLFSVDGVQGDYVVGPLIDINGTSIISGGGSWARATFNFSNIKHEIDSSASSTTAYSPDTIRLTDLDRAAVSLINVNTQPSDPIGIVGLPVTNSILKLAGTKKPTVTWVGCGMGSATATVDYVIDDAVSTVKIPKDYRSGSYGEREFKDVFSNSAADIVYQSRQATQTGSSTDANPRHRMDAAGRQQWGDGTAAVDVNLYRVAQNRLGTDYAFQARRIMARGGTTLVPGDFTLSAGWGTTASVSVDSVSNDQKFRITVTSSGTGQAANPTITLAFVDNVVSGQKWTVAPICVAGMGTASTGTKAQITTGSLSPNILVLTYNGTPVAGSTYIIDAIMLG